MMYLRKALFTFMILALPFMTLPSKAMNEDHDRSTISAQTPTLQQDPEDSDASMSLQLTKTLDSEESSLSYCLRNTSRVLSFATKSWENTAYVVVGLTLYLVPAVAADIVCNVGCMSGKSFDAPSIYDGCDLNKCKDVCYAFNPQIAALCGREGVAGSMCKGSYCQ